MKNIKKSIVTGTLALAMVLTAVPATANAGSASGSYSTVTLTRTSTGTSTITATTTGKNRSNTSRYINVYVKRGASYTVASTISSANGVVSSGGSKSCSATGVSKSGSYWGTSVIHSGTSVSSSTLESIHTN